MQIWSRGDGEAPALDLLIARATSLYDGGVTLAALVGRSMVTNHPGVAKSFLSLQDSVLRKYWVQSERENLGMIFYDLLK